MKIKELKQWLEDCQDDELIRVYLQGKEDSLITPNMGYALRNEIFKWQDKIDDIDCSEDGFLTLYLLAEDILNTLESRLAVNSDFVEQVEKAIKDNQFVEFDCIDDRSFFDLVNDYASAIKIGELVRAAGSLIIYVKNRVPNVDCYLTKGRLFITPKNNYSLSTSIIADCLGINIKNIDDSQWENRKWSIKLNRR